MAKVNIKTISQLVGVAPSTVSRVMSGNARKYRIAKATEQKIMDAAESLGFKPNYLAQSLNTNKTFTIGLVFANTVDEFLGSILEGAEARLRDTEYQLTIATCENSIELEKKEIQRMLYRQVDGIIIYPSAVALTDTYTTDHLKQKSVKYTPYIVIGRQIDFETDHILFSDYKAGVLAAQHFLKQPDNKIFAFLTLPISCSANAERQKGFIDTLSKHGVGDDQIRIITPQNESVNSLAQQCRDIDAFFSVNTDLLLTTVDTLQGRVVFNASNLFAIGKSNYHNLFNLNLKTLPMPGREMGWQAAERMLDKLQNIDPPQVQTTYLNWPDSNIGMSH